MILRPTTAIRHKTGYDKAYGGHRGFDCTTFDCRRLGPIGTARTNVTTTRNRHWNTTNTRKDIGTSTWPLAGA